LKWRDRFNALASAGKMTKPGSRTSRLAEQIQRDLAEILRIEMNDRRLGLVTLTDVELSPDHSHAKVFFTTIGGTEGRSACEALFATASGFLRSRLAHEMSTRTVPQLQFQFDESVERGMRLSRLIDDAVADDRRRGED
jgi:ribosome-binding factor A